MLGIFMLRLQMQGKAEHINVEVSNQGQVIDIENDFNDAQNVHLQHLIPSRERFLSDRQLKPQARISFGSK